MKVRNQIEALAAVYNKTPDAGNHAGIMLAVDTLLSIMPNGSGNLRADFMRLTKQEIATDAKPDAKSDAKPDATTTTDAKPGKRDDMRRHDDGKMTGIHNPHACQAWTANGRQCRQTEDLNDRGLCRKYHPESVNIITPDDIARVAGNKPAGQTVPASGGKTSATVAKTCAGHKPDGTACMSTFVMPGGYCRNHASQADAKPDATTTDAKPDADSRDAKIAAMQAQIAAMADMIASL